jgi:hypothetical protein
MLTILLLACSQAADLETLVGRLSHDDPAQRETAVKELKKSGPQVVPRLLSLHRTTASEEVRLRAEDILFRWPFPAYVQTRTDELIHKKLQDVLLNGLDTHQSLAGCWRDPQERTPFDPGKILLRRQGGSGHGQTLHLDEITPRKEGGWLVRRIAYERPTPYRPEVPEERVRAVETVLDEGETRGVASLLEAALPLRPLCSKKADDSFWTSADFTIRFRLESAGKLVWRCGYTGYRTTSDQNKYAHGEIVNDVFDHALRDRSWTPSTINDEDRRRLLHWIEENFDGEGWWVRERYLRFAVIVGDDSFVPFLRRVGKEVQGKEGASETRLAKSVKEGLKRITGSEE